MLTKRPKGNPLEQSLLITHLDTCVVFVLPEQMGWRARMV